MRAKKKARFKMMRFRKNDPLHNLYAAVQHYVHAKGGNIVIEGGVAILEWPRDPKFTYHIAVRCVGKKPDVEKESAR